MKAGRILRIAGQSYINNVPEHHRESATNTLNTVLAAAEMFNDELAAVVADTKLSLEGRAEADMKVAAAALTKLAAVESTIKTLTERATSLEAKLLGTVTYRVPKDPGERLSHEMHLAEIRDQLRQLPLLERTNIYRTSDDPLVLAAIETSTMTLSAERPDGSRRLEPFIDAEEMRAVKLERGAKADPATTRELHEVRALREIYSHAINSVKAEIKSEVSGATVEV